MLVDSGWTKELTDALCTDIDELKVCGPFVNAWRVARLIPMPEDTFPTQLSNRNAPSYILATEKK